MRQKFIVGINDLESTHPELAAEWHLTQNGNLTPQTISSDYASKVWWVCVEGHEWKATPSRRVAKSLNCPVCFPRVADSFSETYPELAAEWHPTKNGDLTPQTTPRYYASKVWWVCVEGHEWQATPSRRVAKSLNCPVCFPRVADSFSETYPELAAEWHPTKNGDLTPQIIPAYYTSNVWWVCVEGHEWRVSPQGRIKDDKCPNCLVNKLVQQYISDRNKSVLPELHPTKNINIPKYLLINTVDDTSVSFWWVCKQGHEWKSSIAKRNKGKDCSICSGEEIIEGETDLVSTYPSLAAEWHSTKNGGKRLKEVSQLTNDTFWWVCVKGHEWKASPRDMGSNHSGHTGCPVCKNYTMLTKGIHPSKNDPIDLNHINIYSDLKIQWTCSVGHEWKCTLRKRIVKGNRIKGCPLCKNLFSLQAEWSPQNVSPSSVIANSPHDKYLWVCAKGHEWEQSPYSRTREGKCARCPICTSMERVKSGRDSFDITHPKLAQELHPTKNGSIRANDIYFGSNNKYWWVCAEGHEWQSFISNRIRGNNCSECKGNANTVVCGVNDLATSHLDLAAEWHPTKNKPLTSQQVAGDSTKRVWWLGKCGHEWMAAPRTRTSAKKGCTKCVVDIENKVVTIGVNDLETTNPELAEEWHTTKNGTLTPEQVTAGSTQNVWWLGKCEHEWEASPVSRVISKSIRCKVCVAVGRTFAGHNDLATSHPELVPEWHPTKNGRLTPEQVKASSHQKIWWSGSCGHDWEAPVSFRTTMGYGCRQCSAVAFVSKKETEVYNFIASLGVDSAIIQSDRKTLGGKELDIYIPAKNIAIEFNGVYYHSEKFHEPNYHYDKWKACKALGIRLIQIWEDDWDNRPNPIKSELRKILAPCARETAILSGVKSIVRSITMEQANQFLKDNHILGSTSGSIYLGLMQREIDTDTDTLHAVTVLTPHIESESGDNVLEINRYADDGTIASGISQTLYSAIKLYTPNLLIAAVDNCTADGALFEKSGFYAECEFEPEYTYLLGTHRVPKTFLTMDRFKTSPKLEWCEGFTIEELAYLNDLERVWDAGKTIYKLLI